MVTIRPADDTELPRYYRVHTAQFCPTSAGLPNTSPEILAEPIRQLRDLLSEHMEQNW
jgi:hypothetical protein